MIDLKGRNPYHAVITESIREQKKLDLAVKEEESIQAEVDRIFEATYGHLTKRDKEPS